MTAGPLPPPRRDAPARRRADFLAAQGILVIVRPTPAPPPRAHGQPPQVPADPAEGDEVLLAVWDDGGVTALHGHVDLGTGLATALAQIVAEELDVEPASVRMLLGSTAAAPNQGATIASASIQIHGEPLRRAAAQARAWLAAHGGIAALAGRRTVLQLDVAAPVKAAADYRLVGTSHPRTDIPAKLAGALVFVHDLRLPGMLHGRVVRPPYAGADHGEYIGNTLESVDESSIAHIPGLRPVVVQRDFVGVVAALEEHAEQALRELRLSWRAWPGMPDLRDPAQALRDNPRTQRVLVDDGDVDAAVAGAAQALEREYLWPYQLHASIGPSCAVAQWLPEVGEDGIALRVWAGSQNPHVLRADLARLMGLADVQVDVIRMEAAGCYGRNSADDVAADAALLARAAGAGAPVRVQLTRAQEHAWEPKGAAQLMQVRGGLDSEGAIAGWSFETSYPSNAAPPLALLLTRTIEPVPEAFEMGDRSARPPYAIDNLRVAVNDMAPIVRASWLRGVSALPNSFAHESYIDELASAAAVDPVQFRLRNLQDPRAIELIQATAHKAGWRARTGPQEASDGGLGPGGDILFGQGFAYARYVHSKWPGFGASWAAWVADVEVNRKTGEVHVRRVVVGQDAGQLINPAGVEHQLHGNVIQTTSRALLEQVPFAPPASAAQGAQLPGVLPSGVVASREWGSYPIIDFRNVPVIEVLHMPRPGEAPLGVGESSSVPGTAAIANAIFDATGVRFRAPPFTPEVVRAALHPLAPKGDAQTPPDPSSARAAHSLPASAPHVRRHRGLLAGAGALLLGVVGAVAGLFGWRPAIAPVTLSAPVYSAQTIERGRVLAALGDCVVCHSAPGGVPNAGGRAIETPFGNVYSTNLTPDADTGLGRWSFSAFQRAMREGLSRDGKHLYPAFPYTAFARTSDDDLQALYAYLQSLPAVAALTPPAQMRFPFSLRPLMALWNARYLDTGPTAPVPAPSAEWQHGAYLVDGLGHCGACHTPRNALGAEQGGARYLAGALADGWEAPPLTALSTAAVPWDAEALYQYLRHGHASAHGSAGGPMAEVVRELAAVPDADIRAMATYLASFNPPPAPEGSAALARRAVQRAASSAPLPGPAQRLFDGACAACHHDGNGPTLLGLNTPLALSGKLTSARPDNLLRTILEGVQQPASAQIGFMPAFAEDLSDAQIAQLAGYMRQRFAPQEPAWPDLPAQVARVRAARAAATR